MSCLDDEKFNPYYILLFPVLRALGSSVVIKYQKILVILLITYNFIVRLLTMPCPFSMPYSPAAFSVRAKRIAKIGEMCASPQYDSQPSPFRFYHHVGFFPRVWQQETHGNKELVFQEHSTFEKRFLMFVLEKCVPSIGLWNLENNIFLFPCSCAADSVGLYN